MLQIKTIFRRLGKTQAKETPAPRNAPTPLDVADLKNVAGGLPNATWPPSSIRPLPSANS